MGAGRMQQAPARGKGGLEQKGSWSVETKPTRGGVERTSSKSAEIE